MANTNQEIAKLKVDVAKLKADVASLQASDAQIKIDIAALRRDVDAIHQGQASQDQQISTNTSQIEVIGEAVEKLEARVDALEGGELPPEPTPEPPVANCTVTQLPSPPFTVKAEADDAGADADYDWRMGDWPNGPDQPEAERSGRVVQYSYPHEGKRTIVLTVTTPGGVDQHSHQIDILKPDGGGPEPEPPVDEPEWSDPTPFANDARILGHLGVLHAVGRNDAGALAHRRSNDQGKTWSAPVAIPGSDGAPGQYVAIAGDGPAIYVLVVDASGFVYCHRSPDSGATWGARVRITPTGDGTAFRIRIGFVARAGLLHVIIGRLSDGVTYWRSANQGATWSSVVMATGPNEPHVPTIDVDGSAVHVAWSTNIATDCKVYYRRSSDGGLSWLGASVISPGVPNKPSIRPRLVARGGKVLVAWQQEASFQGSDPNATDGIDVCVRRSLDGGATWQAVQQLTDVPAGVCYTHATLTAGPGEMAHLSFFDEPGTRIPYYMKSEDFGATWGAIEEISSVPAHPFNLAVTDEYAHVVLTGTPFSYTSRPLFAEAPPDGSGGAESGPDIDETFTKYASRDAMIGTPPEVMAITDPAQRRQAEIEADRNGKFRPPAPWTSFSEDETWRHTLETNPVTGKKARTLNYDFVGNPCKTIHCMGNIIFAPQRRVLVLFDYVLSSNWGGLIAGCPAPSDFKTLFIDTQGEESGRNAYHVGAHGSLDPAGDPMGGGILQPSLGNHMEDVYTFNLKRLDVRNIIGKRVRAVIDHAHSTDPTKTDGHIYVWHAIGDGPFELYHRITGLSTWADSTKTKADRHAGVSYSHNKDKGPDALVKLFNDRIAIQWTNLPEPGTLPGWLL